MYGAASSEPIVCPAVVKDDIQQPRLVQMNLSHDIGVVAMCMACGREFSEPIETCPHCHVGVSRMRMCPNCHKWISAVHSKCIHCAWSFLDDFSEPTGELESQRGSAANVEKRRRSVRHIVVSAIVFLLVFSGTLYLTRIRQNPLATTKPHKIATSYALRRTPIYNSSSLTGTAIDHVLPAQAVAITGFASPEASEHWLQIISGNVTGYVGMREFSPPKPLDPEEGYALLSSVLLAIDDPKLVLLADDAVTFYQHEFPVSQHGEQLAWLLAEKARELSQRSAGSQLLPIIRRRYQEIAAGNGPMAADARKQLVELPEIQTRTSPRRTRRSASELDVVGSSIVQNSATSAQH
jgi:hypothetical protein